MHWYPIMNLTAAITFIVCCGIFVGAVTFFEEEIREWFWRRFQ